MAENNGMRLASVCLLRAALIGGIYVVLLFVATMNPTPGISSEMLDLVNLLSEIAIVVGVIAPLLVIIGAALTLFSRRSFTHLDWASLFFGIGSALLPALFILAYSNCPGGRC